MTLTLIGAATSATTQRVLLVLQELGVEYEFTQLILTKGEHKDPKYTTAVHPFGRVPALQDGEFQLFESRAICRYLVSKFSDTRALDAAYSADTQQIGAFEQAVSIEYSYFDPLVKSLCHEMLWKTLLGKGDADLEEVEKAKSALMTCLDYYENLLTKQDYLAGDKFTLVDIYVTPWVSWFRPLGLDEQISRRPRFEAWWKRVTDRPSWQYILKLLPKDG